MSRSVTKSENSVLSLILSVFRDGDSLNVRSFPSNLYLCYVIFTHLSNNFLVIRYKIFSSFLNPSLLPNSGFPYSFFIPKVLIYYTRLSRVTPLWPYFSSNHSLIRFIHLIPSRKVRPPRLCFRGVVLTQTPHTSRRPSGRKTSSHSFTHPPVIVLYSSRVNDVASEFLNLWLHSWTPQWDSLWPTFIFHLK